MPKLVTSITAEVLSNYMGDVYLFNSVSGEINFEDYIKLGGFIAYLQNFTQVSSTQTLEKPSLFGLKNQYNLPIVTLNISY
jgi:hypothetical protein